MVHLSKRLGHTAVYIVKNHITETYNLYFTVSFKRVIYLGVWGLPIYLCHAHAGALGGQSVRPPGSRAGDDNPWSDVVLGTEPKHPPEQSLLFPGEPAP